MNPYLIPLLIPRFPHDNPKPPTIYALLNSIVNFGAILYLTYAGEKNGKFKSQSEKKKNYYCFRGI